MIGACSTRAVQGAGLPRVGPDPDPDSVSRAAASRIQGCVGRAWLSQNPIVQMVNGMQTAAQTGRQIPGMKSQG